MYSDCRNLLRASSYGGRMPEPTNPSPQPEPNEKLVKIFDAEQESEAIVVQGLLESAGIDSDLKSIDAVQDAFPGVGGTVILVREEDAPEAVKIIEAYRKLPPLDDETADIRGKASVFFPVETRLPAPPAAYKGERGASPVSTKVTCKVRSRESNHENQCSSATSGVTDFPSK